MSQGINLAILGAVGVNGDNLLQVLHQRQLPVAKLHVLDQDQYLGRKVDVGSKLEALDSYNNFSFEAVDLAIASGEIPQEVETRLSEQGCNLIRTVRAEDDADSILQIADINNDRIPLHETEKILVASDVDCIMASVLSPLHDEVGLTEVAVTWISAVCNHGRPAVEGLAQETAQLLNGKPASARAFNEKIAFNMLTLADDQSKSRFPHLWHQLWGDTMGFDLDCLIAPLFFGDQLTLRLKTEQAVAEAEIQSVLQERDWMELVKKNSDCRLSSSDSVGAEKIFFDGVKALDSHNQSFRINLVVDAPRFGNALNKIKIADYLAKNLFVSYS